MNTLFARNEKEAINYINSVYGIESGTENHVIANEPVMWLEDGMTARLESATCACGDSPAWRIYDADLDEVECIIICECCWEDASNKERI